MNSSRAICILEAMAIDMTGALGGLSKTDSMVDLLQQRLEAINTAQEALRKLKGFNVVEVDEYVSNGDNIRGMNNEKLAMWLAEHRAKESFLRVSGQGVVSTGASRTALVQTLYETYLSWLRQPCEEE